ncbi:CdaR family protein [Phaeodactylibacter sp.]|uniref:CdaR family protein n=1 Tax=Phaeodactylibacter sp. TaxID=1940289 RepID=UPI0032EB2F7A
MACIGIAFVFWLLIKLSQTYRAQKEVYFEIQLPQGASLSALPPDNLVVDLEGTGWDLLFDHFYSRKLGLEYNMEGLSRLNLSRGQLRSDIQAKLHSDDINVLEINYDELNLVAEEQAQRRVPINPVTVLSFAPAHQLKKPVELLPDSVTLTGPESIVSQYDAWSTDSLVYKNLKQSLLTQVRLQKPPPEVTLSPQTTEANIEVEPFTEKSVYVPLVVKNAPDSLRIFPEKVTVTSKLGLSQYDRMTYEDFTAEVDLKGMVPNSSGTTAPIIITKQPSYIQSLFFTPKSARFFFVEEADTVPDQKPPPGQ